MNYIMTVQLRTANTKSIEYLSSEDIKLSMLYEEVIKPKALRKEQVL
jgi:hypothetical protein